MSNSIYADLLSACSQAGCPICRLIQQAVSQYFDSLFYESVNDIPIREKLRGSLGFCSLHTRQVLETEAADALGVSIIYHDILVNILRNLASTNQPTSQGGRLTSLLNPLGQQSVKSKAASQALTPVAPCPACQVEEETTHLAITALLDALGRDEMQAALASSGGLCLSHLRLAFNARKPAASAALTTILQHKLTALDHELAEFIRKSDYRFTGEAIGSERDAWKRVLRWAGGERPGKPS